MKMNYNRIIKHSFGRTLMQTQIAMTEEKAFEHDVTTMSNEELVATIHYLDMERKRLTSHIHDKKRNYNKLDGKIKAA
jgi:hypothetical protein